jgi:phage FluMu gp28-like protein
MPLDALPDVFLPYQKDLVSSVARYAVTVAEKSRRTGYSWTVAEVAVEHAALKKSDGGMNVYYMGYNFDMAREFIGYVADWAGVFQHAASAVEEFVFPDPDHPERDIKAFRVTFDSGFEVVALPSVPRVLRGKQGLVILDEAAFIDDLEEVLKAALALLMWGGKVVVISTHNGDANPFNVLVNDVRAGKKPYHLLRLTLDEALSQGLYKRICFTRGRQWTAEGEAEWRRELLAVYGDNADEELHVIPSPGTGTYLPTPLIEARMRGDIPVLRLERTSTFTLWPEHMREADIKEWIKANLDPILAKLDPALAHCFGFDFARKVDLSVFMPAAIGKDLVRRVPFLLEMRNVPFAQQRQVLWHIIERLPRKRAGKMDAGGNGQETAELTVQKFGTWIEPVMLTEPWYRENMPPYKGAFEEATIELPRDSEVLNDHRAVKLVRGVGRVPEHSAGEDGKKRHGDSAIAGALMYAASRADPEFYGYDAASTRAAQPGTTSTGWRDRPDTWAEDHPLPGRGIMPPLRGGLMPMGRRA